MKFFRLSGQARWIVLCLSTAVFASTGVAAPTLVSGLKDFYAEISQISSKSSSSQQSTSGTGFASCPHIFPGKQAIHLDKIETKWKVTGLCANHFAVVHSGLSKTPLIVIEKINKETLANAVDEKRTDEFYADQRLSRNQRSELGDFKGSGFDRGHMAPAADQPDQESMAQSFSLSNMVPQDPVNNRKIWAKVESDVRKFARRAQGNVYVYSGPLFSNSPRKIGNGVWIPDHLWKLVYDEASGRSWAYILPNTSDARIEKPMDYAEFLRKTGWNLLPQKL